MTHFRRGDPELALPWLERSLEGSQRYSEILSLAATGSLGEARAACGAAVEALPLLEQAAERAASIRFVPGLAGILGALGEGYLLAGRLTEARHTAERMLELTRASGDRHYEADALRILGEVHARVNPAEDAHAEESYLGALAIAERIGARPLAARCHLDLGRLYRVTGQQESAKRHLDTAATMFRDIEMRSWLEKAKAERSELA